MHFEARPTPSELTFQSSKMLRTFETHSDCSGSVQSIWKYTKRNEQSAKRSEHQDRMPFTKKLGTDCNSLLQIFWPGCAIKTFLLRRETSRRSGHGTVTMYKWRFGVHVVWVASDMKERPPEPCRLERR